VRTRKGGRNGGKNCSNRARACEDPKDKGIEERGRGRIPRVRGSARRVCVPMTGVASATEGGYEELAKKVLQVMRRYCKAGELMRG
jgi:hypothetical protein